MDIIKWLCTHPSKWRKIKTLHREFEDRFPRNRECYCGSKIKHKYCCWPKLHQPGDKMMSKIAIEELAKDQVWSNKKYKRITK